MLWARFGRAWRCGGVIGALALALAQVSAATSMALAQDGSASWNPFQSERASYRTELYDRQFVQRWESNPPRGYPTLSKANIEATKTAIAGHEKIVENGGWGKVPAKKMYLGMSGSAVRALHERLFRSGHLREASFSARHFGADLERALKRFQASNGLSPTGVTDRRTIAALNIPAEVRLRQLKINLARLRKDAKSDSARYLVVNIPSAQVEAVENGKVVSRHAGVVGKRDRATPILSSRVHEINFNPTWHLPPTVISEDLIPKGREMQGGKEDVLTKFGIDAYAGGRKVDPKTINWRSSEPRALTFRQKPGKSNPLGFAKINFHNSHSVYLHDTPSDRLFGRNYRAASSGCVRVENIEGLLAWILAANDGWHADKIAAIKESGETETVRVKTPVPLHMVYITAWATSDGIVQFRRDLYGRDGVGDVAASY